MFDSSVVFRAMLMTPALKEALANFEKTAEEYRVLGKGDFDCWVRWGYALIDVRNAYKYENNNKTPSRKQMVEYCKKYNVAACTGYRWIAIASYELLIRQRIKELGCAVKQREMLEWIKQWNNNS